MSKEQFNHALCRFFSESGSERMAKLDQWFVDDHRGVEPWKWRGSVALANTIQRQVIDRGMKCAIDVVNDHECTDQLCDCRKEIREAIEERMR